MRTILAFAAVAALLGSTAAVDAATITFTAKEDAGPTTTITTPDSSSAVGPATFGDFNVLITGATQGFLPSGEYLQGQTIDVQTTSTVSHTLFLQVLGIGVNAAGLQNLLSEFDATGLSAGWQATIATDINGTILASHTFTGPASSGFDVSTLTTLPGTFNASLDFTIVTNGGGSANLGGALSAAAVPGPLAGAGLPGLAMALGMWGLSKLRRRRREELAGAN